MRTKILAATAAVAASLVLTACGGGDDVTASSSTATLSGTAAVGVPIVAGQVSVVCSGGSALSTTTGTGGAWQVTTSGQTLPCAVQVSGGTVGGIANSTPYHSIAMSFGTVNITPLTDLVVARLAGNKAPNTWFSGLNAAALQGVTNTALTEALNKVNTVLGLSATLNGANPLTTRFTAANGNLIDDILEAIAKARLTANLDHADLLMSASTNGFPMPADFNFSTAYAAVKGSSGGSSSTCTSTQTNTVYDGTGPYTKGQKVCFTASATSLAFSGKTLTNPTPNTVVSLPYSAYSFVDGAYTYEVVFNANALYEINVSEKGTGKFHGQFTPAASGGTGGGTGGTGGNANLVVQVSASGIAAPSISVGSVPVPASQSEFCDALSQDTTFNQIGTSAGGSLTVDSCSFSNKVGNISATLKITKPIALSLPYSVTYTYQ